MWHLACASTLFCLIFKHMFEVGMIKSPFYRKTSGLHRLEYVVQAHRGSQSPSQDLKSSQPDSRAPAPCY